MRTDSNTDSEDRNEGQPSIGLAVLARVAELGRGKTRLASTLGPERALEIYRDLIRTCAKAIRSSGLPARIYFDPAPGDFEVWEPGVFAYSTQVSSPNLGVRLAAVAQDALTHFDAVLLLGTDCPYLTGESLLVAAEALRQHDAVLGPSLDGGYYLLGIRTFNSELFSDDIVWSSASVASQTREVLAKAGLRISELDELSDVDEASDWDNFCAWRAVP